MLSKRNQSTPPQLSRVCLDPQPYGQLNMSWEIFPCHLQNGADITYYVLQSNRTLDGYVKNTSTRNNPELRRKCGVWTGGHYICSMPATNLFASPFVYSFQVAAVNSYGELGPFSNELFWDTDIQSML